LLDLDPAAAVRQHESVVPVKEGLHT
jgi:hypothetical protein